MRSTNFIVATTVVIAATLNFGAEGFPRPQADIRDGSTVVMVDGFAFDGPVSGLKPSTQGSGLLRTTSNPLNPTPAPTTIPPEVVQCAQNCQVTSEYNPVCGSDGVMYNNVGTLVCTRNCGINVTELHFGRCSTPNMKG